MIYRQFIRKEQFALDSFFQKVSKNSSLCYSQKYQRRINVGAGMLSSPSHGGERVADLLKHTLKTDRIAQNQREEFSTCCRLIRQKKMKFS